jgi:hypothetical protein
MKTFYLIFTIFLVALAILSNVCLALAQTINPPKQEISSAGFALCHYYHSDRS